MKTATQLQNEIKATVLHALHEIVPEVDLQTLNPDVPWREELDMDSMDFFRLMVKIHDTLHLDIPESDYGKLTSLNKCVDYLTVRLTHA